MKSIIRSQWQMIKKKARKSIVEVKERDAVAGIRRGLEDVRRGRTEPALRAFEDIRKKHGIPARKR
jgi:hypothetical protein